MSRINEKLSEKQAEEKQAEKKQVAESNNLPVPVDFKTALQEEVTELVGQSFGQLLKFDANTSKFSIIGGEEVEVGREYIAHCPQYARGYTKFVDKKPVDVRIKRLTDGKPPKREELDDLHLSGGRDDSWVFQRYLPLEDVKTGEIVTYVSKSTGGKIALGNLLQAYDGSRGKPMIRLTIGSFNTSGFGRKPRPDFKIFGWTGGTNVPPLPEPPNDEPLLWEPDGDPDEDFR